MSADHTRVNQWIWTVLSADGLINTTYGVGQRIYLDGVPQGGGVSPMIFFQYMGGADRVLSLRTRFTNGLWLIRAVADGFSYDPVEPIADRMDEILTVPDQGVVVRGVRIASCYREQPAQRKDAENGVPTVYLGGMYRIKFQPLEL